MALEATHIRYALDNKDRFDVSDETKYVSGTVYPDSRYPTGIARTLTHDDSQMQKNFWSNDDFRKGWAAHLLYDKIQQSVRVVSRGVYFSLGRDSRQLLFKAKSGS